eukprot:scaffold1239_cov175-Pinguiococcus_pyrenoidosus.AAC.39
MDKAPPSGGGDSGFKSRAGFIFWMSFSVSRLLGFSSSWLLVFSCSNTISVAASDFSVGMIEIARFRYKARKETVEPIGLRASDGEGQRREPEVRQNSAPFRTANLLSFDEQGRWDTSTSQPTEILSRAVEDAGTGHHSLELILAYSLSCFLPSVPPAPAPRCGFYHAADAQPGRLPTPPAASRSGLHHRLAELPFAHRGQNDSTGPPSGRAAFMRTRLLLPLCTHEAEGMLRLLGNLHCRSGRAEHAAAYSLSP